MTPQANPHASATPPSTPSGAQPPRQPPPRPARGQPRLASGETSRSAARSRTSATGVHNGRQPSLLRIAAHLQPRDYALALLLDDHRVLTAAQIAAALFTSPRTCANRLSALRTLSFIDRFTTRRYGYSSTTCWVPGLLSARYAALHRGDRPPTAAAVRDRQDATLASPTLAHTLGTNQFFIDLIAHSRAHPDTRLARWWSARRTAAALGQRIRPDGYGVWRAGDRSVHFWLEHDTGTESLPRLAAKLRVYERLATAGVTYPLLFWLPTTARETHLHDRLMALGCQHLVATAARDAAHDPAGRVWRIVARGPRRWTLADLPCTGQESSPLSPGPPTEAEDPVGLVERKVDA